MFLITLLSNFIHFILLEFLCTRVYGKSDFKYLKSGLFILTILKSLSFFCNNQYINLVISISVYFGMIIIHNLESKKSLALGVFWLVIFYGSTMFSEVFSFVFIRLLTGVTIETIEISSNLFIIANFISIFFKIAIIYLILLLYKIKFHIIQNKMFMLLLMLPISLVFIVLSIDLKHTDSFSISLLIAIVCFMASIICTVYAVNYMLKQEQEKHKLELESTNRQIDLQYHQQIEEKMAEWHALKHDMIKHLNSINRFIEQNENETAMEYINELTKQYNKTRIVYTGNNLIDTVLNSYTQDIDVNDIEMNFSAMNIDLNWISPVDMTCILGNILDNAIYSCKHSKRKVINLYILKKGDYVIIKVVNSCDIVCRFDGCFHSIKRHGDKSYGLENITRCTMKYNGQTIFKFNDSKNEFSSTLILPLMSKEAHII